MDHMIIDLKKVGLFYTFIDRKGVTQRFSDRDVRVNNKSKSFNRVHFDCSVEIRVDGKLHEYPLRRKVPFGSTVRDVITLLETYTTEEERLCCLYNFETEAETRARIELENS